MHEKTDQTPAKPEGIVKTSLLIFVPLFAMVLFSLATFYYSRTQANHEIVTSSEVVRLNLLSKDLNTDIQAVISDLRYLSSIPHVRRLLSDKYDSGADASQMVRDEFAQFAQAQKIYDQIRILNDQGDEMIRINYNAGIPESVPEQKLQNKKGRYYFNDTFNLNHGDIFISPLDLNIEFSQIERPLKPMIRFGTPLFDADGEKTGILLLNYLGSELLNRIKDLAKTSAGNCFLLNRSGYYLYAENPHITWGFMFPQQAARDNTMAHDHPDAWSRITESLNGQFEDHKGLYTFDTIYPLIAGTKSSTGSGLADGDSATSLNQDEYYWKLVTFLPHSNLYDYNHSLQLILGSFLFVISMVLGFGALKFAQIKESNKKHKEEIKTLHGIIPICMYCKEIRDDKGSWKQIELYISQHSDAEFSHGICDRCMQKHMNTHPSKEQTAPVAKLQTRKPLSSERADE